MKRFLAMSALVALAGAAAVQAQEAEQVFPLNPGPAAFTEGRVRRPAMSLAFIDTDMPLNRFS